MEGFFWPTKEHVSYIKMVMKLWVSLKWRNFFWPTEEHVSYSSRTAVSGVSLTVSLLVCFFFCVLFLLLYFVEKQAPWSCAACGVLHLIGFPHISVYFLYFLIIFLTFFFTKGKYMGVIRRFGVLYVWSAWRSPCKCQKKGSSVEVLQNLCLSWVSKNSLHLTLPLQKLV